MNHSVSIGARLREERQRLGMSQPAFGEVAGVTKKTQMLYEAGERSPDALYLAAIAAVGADALYVLTGQRSQPALTPDKVALLDNYDHASEEGRDAARRVLSSLSKQKAA